MDPLEGVTKLGRPKADMDVDVIERAASIGCTMDEIAALLGICRATMFARAKAEPEIQAAFDRGRDNGRSTLRRLQWHKAHAGSDTMLIWLGKQLLDQRDKADVDSNVRFPEAPEDTRPALASLFDQYLPPKRETQH